MHQKNVCIIVNVKKVKMVIALNRKPVYRALLAIWDCTVSATTWHGWTCPVREASTRFTYPRGMEGWVDLGGGYIPRLFTCLPTVTVTVQRYICEKLVYLAASAPEVFSNWVLYKLMHSFIHSYPFK